MRACALVPAYDAERSVGRVTAELVALWPEQGGVIVVDDGSDDRTATVAAGAGARVVSHAVNRGKGAALRTGLALARQLGFDVAVTVDADGQHLPSEAVRMLSACDDPGALVLGVRDMEGARAPRANILSNRISNFFLSLFTGRPLADTQCGMRRYPVERTLELDARDDGYAFEAEVILRALAAGVPLVEVPVEVFYPEHDRVTHFHSVRDPARIVVRVVKTLLGPRPAAVRPAPEARARPSAPGTHHDAAIPSNTFGRSESADP